MLRQLNEINNIYYKGNQIDREKHVSMSCLFLLNIHFAETCGGLNNQSQDFFSPLLRDARLHNLLTLG